MKKKKKNNSVRPWQVVLLVVLVMLLILGILLARRLAEENIPTLELPQETAAPGTETTVPAEPVAAEPVLLDCGLRIESVSRFAGMYMEDGTNETVSDVMMILLENTTNQDLQLARISLEYPDFTAEFEVTNLPAGEKVVALEMNRHSASAEDILSATASNVVFFPEPMGLQEERFEITGSNGVLSVTNISDADISGRILIYYKHSASDLLYGGITYRVRIEDGLSAGETAQIVAGHYSPDSSRVLQVVCED